MRLFGGQEGRGPADSLSGHRCQEIAEFNIFVEDDVFGVATARTA
jgi:hypothetical protein